MDRGRRYPARRPAVAQERLALWLIQSRTVVWCSPGQEKEGAEGPNVVLSTRASQCCQWKSSSTGEVLPGAPFLLASNWCVGLQSGVQSVWVHWIPAQEWLSLQSSLHLRHLRLVLPAC